MSENVKKSSYFMVIGCGRLGADLADRLSRRPDAHVMVVDSNPAAFNNLAFDYNGRIFEGDALNHDVLLRAGIDRADAVAVVTNSDATNAVIGHVARQVFKVPVVIVRNYDIQALPMFESFGLQVISSISWAAQRIEEILHHSEIHSVFSAGNGEVEVYELVVPPTLNGHPLADMFTDGAGVPVSLTRAGKAMLPSTDMTVETGDIIHLTATMAGIESMREMLRLRLEE